MRTEIWRTAIYDGEFYDNYKVSNLGRVKSLNYNHTGKERVLKPGKDTNGYSIVILSKNKETKLCLVHRLVATAFLDNPENKPYINHKIEGDEGKTMNMVIFNTDGSVNKEKTTIEWVTPKENNDYGTHNERISKAMTNGKLSKKVLQLTLTGDLIREWPSTMECGRNGFCQSSVAKCCRGEIPKYKGFKWCYA